MKRFHVNSPLASPASCYFDHLKATALITKSSETRSLFIHFPPPTAVPRYIERLSKRKCFLGQSPLMGSQSNHSRMHLPPSSEELLCVCLFVFWGVFAISGKGNYSQRALLIPGRGLADWEPLGRAHTVDSCYSCQASHQQTQSHSAARVPADLSNLESHYGQEGGRVNVGARVRPSPSRRSTTWWRC